MRAIGKEYDLPYKSLRKGCTIQQVQLDQLVIHIQRKKTRSLSHVIRKEKPEVE